MSCLFEFNFEEKQKEMRLGVLAGHSEETLSAAFLRLVSYNLVNVNGGDAATKYRPCESRVDEEYRQWVEDMEKSSSAIENPLRDMPEEVQKWIRTT